VAEGEAGLDPAPEEKRGAMHTTELDTAIDAVISAGQSLLSRRRIEALAERIDAILPLLGDLDIDGTLAAFRDACEDHRLDDAARLWPSVRRCLRKLSKASSIASATTRRREG
jgi:hypothetical protein